MRTPIAMEQRVETIFMEGVAPYRGSHMLRFLRADYEGKENSRGSYIGDMYRVIDISAMTETFSDVTWYCVSP